MKLKLTKTIVALAGLFCNPNAFSMDYNSYDFYPTRVQPNSPAGKTFYFASPTHYVIISGINDDQNTLVHCLNGTDLQETKTVLKTPFAQYSYSAQQSAIAPYENGLVINTKAGIILWNITDTGVKEESIPLKLEEKMNMISCNGRILATQDYSYNNITFYDLSQPGVSWDLHIPGEAMPYLPWNNFGKHFIAGTHIRKQFYLIDPDKENPEAKSIKSWPFDLEYVRFAMEPAKDSLFITGQPGAFGGKRGHYRISNVSSNSFTCTPITSPLPEDYYTRGIFLKGSYVFEIGAFKGNEYGKMPGCFTIYNKTNGNLIWGKDLRKTPISVELINNNLFLAYGNPQRNNIGSVKYHDQEILIFDIGKFITALHLENQDGV